MVGLRLCEQTVVLCCICGISGAYRADDDGGDGILDHLDPDRGGDVNLSALFFESKLEPEKGTDQSIPVRKWQEVEKLSNLSAVDQLNAFYSLGRTLPKENHTAEVFKWLAQRLVHSQGLTTAGQGCIANIMADFKTGEHIRFLKTEPDHYATFNEVAHFCASSRSLESLGTDAYSLLYTVGSKGLVSLLMNFFDMVTKVPGAFAPARMPSDTAEVWVLYAEHFRTSDITKEAAGQRHAAVVRNGIHALIHSISIQKYKNIEDALDWYSNVVHSFPYQHSNVENKVLQGFWSDQVKGHDSHDRRNLRLQILRGDVFYTKLSLPSFNKLLGLLIANSEPHLQSVVEEILQNLVHRIEARSSLDVMTSTEIAKMQGCGNALKETKRSTKSTTSILRACDIRNRTRVFALTAKLGNLLRVTAGLIDFTESTSTGLHLLDLAGQVNDVFNGIPASFLVMNAWRFFRNSEVYLSTRGAYIVQKTMDPSAFEYLRGAYSGLLDNMCNILPSSLVGIAPGVFAMLLNDIRNRSLHSMSKQARDFQGVSCMKSLAKLAPCQLLEADSRIPDKLLTLMRGEVNESCVDAAGNWQDARGYPCKAWRNYPFSCETQARFEGYTPEQAEAVESNCKASCKTCVTAAFDKFSAEQADLGEVFRELSTCKSNKSLFDEFGMLKTIVADGKSFGCATTKVMEAATNVIRRDALRFLKPDILDGLYHLVRQRWPEILQPSSVRHHILQGLSQLVTAAGKVSEDLEVKNTALKNMTKSMKSKNEELEDLTAGMKLKNVQLHNLADSLSAEKEELARVYQSQTEERRSDERVVNLSRHFSGIAHRQVPCKGTACIIPDGWMVKSLNESHDIDEDDMDGFLQQNELFRCPNHEACFGDRAWATKSSSRKSGRMCAKGYSESALGCAKCEIDYGRYQFDPFHCKKCVSLSIATAQYVLPPLAIYVAGLVFANCPPTPAGSIMNVILSFSLTAHCVLMPLGSARVYQEVKAKFGSFIMGLANLPSAGAESTGFGYISYDCIQRQLSLNDKREEENDFIWMWLAFDACVPAVLLLSSFVINYITRIFKPEVSLTRVLVLPVLVFGNAFLPKIFGAALRSYPCIHEIHAHQRVMSYALNMQCNLLNRLPMAVTCSLVCCCIGPVFWAAMFLRSHVWTETEKKETLSYLTAEYQPAFEWWETLVLLRKMSLAAVNTMWPASYAPTSYCLFCSIVVGTALMLHCWCRPFKSAFLNLVETGALFSAFLALAGAQYVTVDAEWTDTVADSYVVLGITLVILTLSFFALVGLWVYTLLVDFGLLRGYASRPANAAEGEPPKDQEDFDQCKSTLVSGR